jgi:hypothetical protein
MKTNLINILLVLLIVLTSATTTSLITYRPAQPKYVIVKHFDSNIISGGKDGVQNIPIFIKKKRKEGWILKSVTGGDGDSGETWFVVMEKY